MELTFDLLEALLQRTLGVDFDGAERVQSLVDRTDQVLDGLRAQDACADRADKRLLDGCHFDSEAIAADLRALLPMTPAPVPAFAASQRAADDDQRAAAHPQRSTPENREGRPDGAPWSCPRAARANEDRRRPAAQTSPGRPPRRLTRRSGGSCARTSAR